MNYQLVKVGQGKVKVLHEIVKKCSQDMKLRFGLRHWAPPYPLHLMRRDAGQKSVYAVCDGDQTVATFTIGTQPSADYDMTMWASPNKKAMYVSHLAVLPDFQGRGIGTWCMKAVEHLATDGGCVAVRLDAYEKHLKLLEFYDRLGYQRRGVIRVQEFGLVCFEKVVKK